MPKYFQLNLFSDYRNPCLQSELSGRPLNSYATKQYHCYLALTKHDIERLRDKCTKCFVYLLSVHYHLVWIHWPPWFGKIWFDQCPGLLQLLKADRSFWQEQLQLSWVKISVKLSIFTLWFNRSWWKNELRIHTMY